MLFESEVLALRTGQTIVARYSGDDCIDEMNRHMKVYYGVLEAVSVSYSVDFDTYGKIFTLVLYKRI